MKSKEDIQKIIGLNLKRERNTAEVSQFDLAIEADLHRNMIDLIERGKTMPTVYTMLKIAESLKIKLPQLLEGIE
jgi:transcriptional regulator with XRE-family HTH domain|tara:strand:- start:138 stop:362 length:225 start_codon:yes stop_codon:yes gene_type:complete